MLRKIITYFLILAVVLPVLASAVPLPAGQLSDGKIFVANVAHAEDTTKKGSNDGEISSPCGAILGIFKGEFWDCISYTAVYISYEFFMQIAIWITGLASDIFNVSIQFSLTGKVFDAKENTMIKDGWTLVRDLLNLVFIFILLFAAISTILQYGNMDIKKILPSLIVVALLVNFSMMIAKMVIDASHIFAWEFYNQIDVTNGGTVSNMKGSVEVSGDFEKKNLANVFMAGFNPQRLLTGAGMATTTTNKDGEKEVTQSPWKQVAATAMANGEGFTSTLWRMAIIIWLEIALAVFASFILLSGAIMFVARIVILWAVMIFSPIAFLGMILPSMDKYSKMWWGYLIGQSFFAPAFLFMFMLTTKFINSGFIDKFLHLTKNNDSKVVTGLSMSEMVSIVFSFLIIGGLMSLCLIVARQLGGKTAEFGIGGAHRVKGWALGAPGNVLKYGKYGLDNRGTRYLGGLAGDSSWWAKSIGRIPGGNILGRKLGALKKADEDKAKKAAEKYEKGLSEAGYASLKRDIASKSFVKRFMYTGPEGAFPSSRKGYEESMNKREEEKKKKAHKKIQKEKEEAEYKVVIQYLGEQSGISKEEIEKVLRDNNDILNEKIENRINEGIQKNISENKKKLIGITMEIKKLEAYMAKNPENKAIQKDLIQKIVEKEKIDDTITDIKQNQGRKNQLDQNRINREQTETLETAVKSTGGDKEKSDEKAKSK